MADEAPTGAPQQPTHPVMRILGQFIRDMSFENIVVQKGMTGEMQPELKV